MFRNSSSLHQYKNRNSMVDKNMIRRSSIFTKKRSNDPRNLRKEKDHYILKVKDFLSTQNFSEEISSNQLKSPSTTLVKKIFLYVLTKLITHFFEFNKFEDDVVLILDMLGYPFSLPKSYLSAPGTPNSWPCVVGAIYWLIEILKYSEKSKKENTFDSKIEITKFEIIAKQYRNYMKGISIDSLTKEISDYYKKENSKIRLDLTNYKEGIEKYEIATSKSNIESKFKKTEETIIKKKSDITKFDQLLTERKNYSEVIKNQRKSLKNAEKNYNRKYHEKCLHEDYRKNELNNQIISFEDGRKLIQAREDNIKEILNIKELRNSFKNEKSKKNTEISSIYKKINAKANGINILNKRSSINDKKLVIDLPNINNINVKHKDDINNITSKDLKKEIKNRVIFKNDEIKEESIKINGKIQEIKNKFNFTRKLKNEAKIKHNKINSLIKNDVHNSDKKENEINEKCDNLSKGIKYVQSYKYNKADREMSSKELKKKYNQVVELNKILTDKFEKIEKKKADEIMKNMCEFIEYRKTRVEELERLMELVELVEVEFCM